MIRGRRSGKGSGRDGNGRAKKDSKKSGAAKGGLSKKRKSTEENSHDEDNTKKKVARTADEHAEESSDEEEEQGCGEEAAKANEDTIENDAENADDSTGAKRDDSTATSGESSKGRRIKLGELNHPSDVHRIVSKHCNVKKGLPRVEHYEKFILHMSKKYRMLGEKYAKSQKHNEALGTSDKNDDKSDLLNQCLKETVGLLATVFFYPTNKVSSRSEEKMIAAGITHRSEFAREVIRVFESKWPTDDKPVPWFENVESKKRWWNGGFGYKINTDSLLYLRMARNAFSTRVCATVGKYSFAICM